MAIAASVLATACGRAGAAPISLPSQIESPGPQLSPAKDLAADGRRLISSLEFPERPDTVFAGALAAWDLVVTDFATTTPVVAASVNDEDWGTVPEPPTAPTLVGGLFLAGMILGLRGRSGYQGRAGNKGHCPT